MKLREAMQTLKQMGTAQNVKTYRRHGAGDNVYGVSFANLNKLKKQIKVDHALAEQLWATGNSDACTLATMIADPEAFTASTADAWLKDISFPMLADLFAGLIARSPLAVSKLKKWTRSRQEITRQAGYGLLAAMLRDDPQQVGESLCREFLERIEEQIHASPNMARNAMNMAVIAIGVYNADLQKAAIAAARHIGKVEVDHGETGCKTPDAESYILKTAARKPRPQRKKKALAKAAT